MTAFTRLLSGEVLRWHAPPAFTECTRSDCTLRHVEREELFADLLAADDVDGAKS